LRPTQQLLFIQSMPPVLCDRVPFWHVVPWQGWVDANPVEGGYPMPAPAFTLNYRSR
jgi:type IV secretion system protein VirD4